MEGRGELMDVALVADQNLADAQQRLQSALPNGMRIEGFRPVPESRSSLCAAIDGAGYEVKLDREFTREAREKIAVAKSAPTIVSRRQTRKGVRYRDIKPLIKELEVEEDDDGEARIRFAVRIGEGGNCNPHELLEAVLGWPEERIKKLHIVRTELTSSEKF
jgi:radical SAM-linked protein